MTLFVHRLANIISPPPRWLGTFIDIGPECFATIDIDDSVIIGYKGEWYTPMVPTLRVRLHNWLIAFGNRKLADQDESCPRK